MRSFTTGARRPPEGLQLSRQSIQIGDVGELQSEPFLTMISVAPW